jgi:hypothetical protein
VNCSSTIMTITTILNYNGILITPIIIIISITTTIIITNKVIIIAIIMAIKYQHQQRE